MLRFMGRKESDTTEGLISDGFPSGSDGKESACNAGDLGSIPGVKRFPGKGNGNPLQYSRKFHGQRNLANYSAWDLHSQA